MNCVKCEHLKSDIDDLTYTIQNMNTEIRFLIKENERLTRENLRYLELLTSKSHSITPYVTSNNNNNDDVYSNVLQIP